MKKYLVMAMAAVAMVGCTQSEDENKNNGPVEIKFGAGIEVAATRAAIESPLGKPTEKITGIQILRGTDGTTPAFDAVSAVTLTGDLETDGKFSNMSTKQYIEKEDVNFIAYYPTGTLSTGKVTYTITGAEDIIVAPVATAKIATPAVSFAFAHKLARIKLVVKATAGAVEKFGDLTAATISVPTALDLAIAADGSTTLAANATPVNSDLSFGGATLVEGNANATNELMVLPAALDKIKLTFAKNITTATEFDIKNLTLEAGKTTTITVTVTSSIAFESATVEDWVIGGENGDTTVE